MCYSTPESNERKGHACLSTQEKYSHVFDGDLNRCRDDQFPCSQESIAGVVEGSHGSSATLRMETAQGRERRGVVEESQTLILLHLFLC